MQTTDNQNELFDEVNESDEVVGVMVRREAHNGGQRLHRAIGVLVFNNQDELFMQKRSLTKDLDAGVWGISCGGHLLSGQTYEEAAHRELQEELGIDGELKFINKHIVKGEKETEIDVLFKTTHNGPFRLHTEEVAEGAFFSLPELEKRIRNEQIKLTRASLINLHFACGLLSDRDDLKSFVVKIFPNL